MDTVVLHATAGSTAQGAIATLRERGLSYHYLVDKDGSVTKLAGTSRAAFHAGESAGPQGPAVNGYSVGVSLVNLNDGRDPYPQAQRMAVEELLGELAVAMPSLRYLTTHYTISPGRKTDPKGYPVAELAAACGLELWLG